MYVQAGDHSEVGVTTSLFHVVMVTIAGKMESYQEDEVGCIPAPTGRWPLRSLGQQTP